MSAASQIAQTAIEHIQALLSDMYESKGRNNYILLGTVGTYNEPIQIQLIVTRDASEFLDES